MGCQSFWSKTSNQALCAVEFGRNIAKKQHTEFFNHGKDGKIQSRDSYGNDPFPPKG